MHPSLDLKKNISVGLANVGTDSNNLSNQTSFRKGLTELFKGEHKDEAEKLDTRKPTEIDELSHHHDDNDLDDEYLLTQEIMESSQHLVSALLDKLLEQQKEMKLERKQLLQREGQVVHQGKGCDSCSRYPIVGARYNCMSCKQNVCSECFELHPDDHILIALKQPFKKRELVETFQRSSFS